MVPEGGAKMNLGFYVQTSGDNELNTEIFDFLNTSVENNEVSDASLFYNEVDFTPKEKKFGSFNSTDLWAFSGTLLVTTLTNLAIASKVVNKINIGYLFDKTDKDNNLISLIQAGQMFPLIVRNEQEKNEIYRITGKMPHMIQKLNVKEILEVFNE